MVVYNVNIKVTARLTQMLLIGLENLSDAVGINIGDGLHPDNGGVIDTDIGDRVGGCDDDTKVIDTGIGKDSSDVDISDRVAGHCSAVIFAAVLQV